MADTQKVVIHQSNLPKGEKVEVLHLGVFENGGTYNLTDEQVANYEAQTGASFPKSGYIVMGDANTKEAKAAAEEAANAEPVQVTNQPEVPDPTEEQVEAAQQELDFAPQSPIAASEQASDTGEEDK